MTVKELIAALKTQSPDADVQMADGEPVYLWPPDDDDQLTVFLSDVAPPADLVPTHGRH